MFARTQILITARSRQCESHAAIADGNGRGDLAVEISRVPAWHCEKVDAQFVALERERRKRDRRIEAAMADAPGSAVVSISKCAEPVRRDCDLECVEPCFDIRAHQGDVCDPDAGEITNEAYRSFE